MTIEEVKQKVTPVLRQHGISRAAVFGSVTDDTIQLDYNKETLKQLATAYGLRFIILHGSFATGKARPDSDIDIAAVTETMSSKTTLSVYSAISRVFEKDNNMRDIDFKLLNNTDPLFRYQVVRDGILLYGNKTDYEEYKAITLRMYEDAKPLRDLEKLLIQRYQNHLLHNYA